MTHYPIKKISPHKHQFQTEKMKVPVVLHISEKLMPGEETLRQLEDVATNDCLFHHIAAMADVHSKPGRKNATGTALASENFIMPQVNDSDPCCGMRMVKTSLTEDNTTPEEIDCLFQKLTDVVPTKKLVGTQIPFELVVDICRGGTSALVEHFGIDTRNELTNSMSRGNFFGQQMSRRDIFNVIPKLFLFFAQYRLGVLGAAGNHFLDLMKITDVVDPETARALGVKKGQYVFMIHAGSGILGQYTMYMYTAKKREHLSQTLMVELGKLTFQSQIKQAYNNIARKIREHGNKQGLLTYDADGVDGRMYMAARNAASNYGVANRATIAHNVSQAIKDVLGRDPEMDLLYDMPHIHIGQEKHFDKNVWVHRNGTTRANGPLGMADHPVFSKTGEPVFVPSSMSTPAYLGVGTDDNRSTFFSSSHGTGLSVFKTEKDVPKNREELLKKMKQKGVNLYNAKSSIVIKQDSAHYKDVSEVIAGMENNKVIKTVAKLQPVSVIMY
ncbi:MAG: RtcB family protein [Candidatus Moranbacteria bacterium]|nr:RtcB family protein [Candidatus Moranbacteria bacterium]